MKYKDLTNEELEALEPEFVKYLAANTITADDWIQIKKHEPTKTSEMISHFSELVLDNILNNIKYLQFNTKEKVMVFHCDEKTITSIILEAPAEINPDFTNKDYFKKVVGNPPAGIKVYSAEKEYSKERNLELFEMTEKGCFPTDENLFEALKKAL